MTRINFSFHHFVNLGPLKSREIILTAINTKAKVLWFTGLSGSGKTTLGKRLEQQFKKSGIPSIMLDGDLLRRGLCSDLGFSAEDRTENIRRVSEVANLCVQQGNMVICTFISPTIQIRQLAKDIIGASQFIEFFVNCSLDICEERDVKGLYAKARSGLIPDFTGISAPYEAPKSPHLILNTSTETEEESCNRVMQYLSISSGT